MKGEDFYEGKMTDRQFFEEQKNDEAKTSSSGKKIRQRLFWE